MSIKLENLAVENWFKEYKDNLKLSSGNVDVAVKHLIRDMVKHIRK